MYLGTHRVSGSTVAVKVMDRSRIKSTSIEREWTVLEHLGKHEHVVEFMGAYANTREVCFTLELCVSLCCTRLPPRTAALD